MDAVAQMLTHIRNAVMAGHETASAPHSMLKEKIAQVLKKEGYLLDFKVDEDKTGKKSLRFLLGYTEAGQSAIRSLKKVSTPGHRVYAPCDQLPYVLNGKGIAIISTSRGIMTDRQARRDKIGGEVLCTIW